ncbi:MAG TPA: asparagine synthase-related protein [Chthonomonadales bacterium]|nr:asparagine synthase-related protein [Chthonomonadales bacterium]
MLAGVERLASLAGATSQPFGCQDCSPDAAAAAGNVAALGEIAGHFSACGRDGQIVRLARTIGCPQRYFVAKMFHGPFLIIADRIDTLFQWCCENHIGWQFDPAYTRMTPAHYLVEIEQIGCPDPAPKYTRFFDPPIGQGSGDIEEAGAAYIRATLEGLRAWLSGIPEDEAIGLAFSGGIDSTSILILADHAAKDLGRNPALIRAFTLDIGGGSDAAQAERVVSELGLQARWERIKAEPSEIDLHEAICVIEDYHPLDVECAATALCLLKHVRSRYPELAYLLDGDGGDENLKSYPLEDSDLTLSSVLRNPLLYLEGWGVSAMKHSMTYSGGLSRSYVRTYAPARRYGFNAFSPYTARPAVARALALPFEMVVNGSVEALYLLKQRMTHAGIRAVTGIDMPVNPKRRFQDGAVGSSYRRNRVGKAWCRQIFLSQWEERLRLAWDSPLNRVSGNTEPQALPVR